MKKVFLGFLLLLIGLGCFGCSNYQVDKTNYQQGIAYLEEQKWDEASQFLAQPCLDHYKDSETLWHYAEAQTNIQKEYINQAAYDVKQIPDNYQGNFREEMLKTKKEILQKAASLTPEQIKEEEKRWTEANASRSTAQSTSKPDLASNTPYLYSGAGNVAVAISETIMDEAIDASISKDYQRFNNLILAGKLLPVKNGTKIDILKAGMARTKVRILEGNYSGQTGFVQTEFVKVK